MTDFDEVLERLVSDDAFKAALAADPQAALAGYRLAEDERELLNAQVVSGDGAPRGVEERLTKSGVVGLVGPVAAAFGVAASGAGAHTIGAAPGSATFGQVAAGVPTMGHAPAGVDSLGHAPTGASTFGEAPLAGQAPASGAQTFGAAGGEQTLGGAGSNEGFGAAPGPDDPGTMGQAAVRATHYHTRVDVDGDGHWDAHTDYERADGGVDIVADMNHDGRIDFIGHDYNRDGLVDVAEYDENRDGVFDTRMHDDTGDGWMDRREHIEPGP